MNGCIIASIEWLRVGNTFRGINSFFAIQCRLFSLSPQHMFPKAFPDHPPLAQSQDVAYAVRNFIEAVRDIYDGAETPTADGLNGP